MSENQKVQRYIIKSTPYGELSDVLKDLDKLSHIDLGSPTLVSAFEQFNEDHLSIVSNAHGQILVMSKCKVVDNQYIDQNNEKIFTIDHIKQQVISVQETTVDLVPQVKELLKYLTTHTQTYVDKYFKTPNGSQAFAEINEQGLVIYLGFTSKNISISKFYTGEWISKWKITKDKIEGTVTIKAHFFEAGNVQFNQKRQHVENFQFNQNMNESAKAVVKIIESFEREVQESLNVVYEEMPTKFFKKLRRLAPYTKTKMSWNLNSIKMNKNLIGLKQ